MDQEKTVDCIKNGRAVLGIEFGSTRIKAVLIDEAHALVASGSHEWENRLEDGIWTYTLDDIWGGLLCEAFGRCEGKIRNGADDACRHRLFGDDARLYGV